MVAFTKKRITAKKKTQQRWTRERKEKKVVKIGGEN